MTHVLVLRDATAAVAELDLLLLEIQDASINPFYKAIVWDALAGAHQRNNNSEQATRCIDQALAIMRRALGDSRHPSLAMVYADAAWIAHCRGDELCFRNHQAKAVDMRWQQVGLDRETLMLVSELLNALSSASLFVESHYWLDRLEKEVPAMELDYATYWYFRGRSQEFEARGEFQQALDIADDFASLLENTPSDWTVLIEDTSLNRAWLKTFLGDYAGARKVYAEWLEQEKILPTDSAAMRYGESPWQSLILQWDAENAGGTDEPLSQSAEVSELGIGSNLPTFHQDAWPAIVNLFLRLGGRPDRQQQLEQWHSQWLQSRSPKHVCFGALKIALAENYLQLGEARPALEFADDGYQILCEVLGDQAGRTIESQLLRARIHVALGNLQQAEELARQAVIQAETACGSDHPLTNSYRMQLAEILCAVEKTTEANTMGTLAAEAIHSRLGSYHPVTKKSKESADRIKHATDN